MTQHHLVVDCSRHGLAERVPATDDQTRANLAQQAEFTARKAADTGQRASDLAAVRERAAADPAYAALARLQGVAL